MRFTPSHSAYEDKLPLEGAFGLRGPCCVYASQILNYPRDEEAYLVLGNNDAFKAWVDGALLDSVEGVRYWMPLNHAYRIRLRKGANELAFKVLRRDRPFEFSVGLRKVDPRPTFNLNDWITDYSSSCPCIGTKRMTGL